YDLSADGQTIGFLTAASNLATATTDGNGFTDAYVRGPDPADPNGVDALLFPNGSLDDNVLEVVDATSGVVTTQCPAAEVAVASGVAVYLRPESTVGTAGCPAGSLNSDGDTSDQVVQLVVGAGSTVNLGLAATAVRIASPVVFPGLVAALVPEAGENDTP